MRRNLLLVVMTFSLEMRQQQSPRIPQLIKYYNIKIDIKLSHCRTVDKNKCYRITINVFCMSNSIHLYILYVYAICSDKMYNENCHLIQFKMRHNRFALKSQKKCCF